jgi:hypothetical protein
MIEEQTQSQISPYYTSEIFRNIFKINLQPRICEQMKDIDNEVKHER